MSSDSAPPGRAARESGEGRREEPHDAPPSAGPSPARPDARRGLERCNALALSFVSFCLISFGVWVVSAGERYRKEYAQATPGWHVGSTRLVELTLVKEDRQNLACAADREIAGLACRHGGDLREAEPSALDESRTLQPYKTVGGELLLGAGLWSSPDLGRSLPGSRFTVVCNYEVKGIMKSAMIRFDLMGRFSPVGQTVAVGTLTECVLP